ncbi:hypothetical protein BDR22DRAFT_884790 [Usnea florida]
MPAKLITSKCVTQKEIAIQRVKVCRGGATSPPPLELAPVLTSSGPLLTPSTSSSAPAKTPPSTPLRSHPYQQDRDLSPLTSALPPLLRRTTMGLRIMEMLSLRQIRTGRLGSKFRLVYCIRCSPDREVCASRLYTQSTSTRRLRGKSDSRDTFSIAKDVLLRMLPLFGQSTKEGQTMREALSLPFVGSLRADEFTFSIRDSEEGCDAHYGSDEERSMYSRDQKHLFHGAQASLTASSFRINQACSRNEPTLYLAKHSSQSVSTVTTIGKGLPHWLARFSYGLGLNSTKRTHQATRPNDLPHGELSHAMHHYTACNRTNSVTPYLTYRLTSPRPPDPNVYPTALHTYKPVRSVHPVLRLSSQPRPATLQRRISLKIHGKAGPSAIQWLWALRPSILHSSSMSMDDTVGYWDTKNTYEDAATPWFTNPFHRMVE